MAARTEFAPTANVLDRLIGYFDPKREQQRVLARAQTDAVRAAHSRLGAVMGGGYNGARRDRAQLSTWNPGGGSPTTDAVADLPALRERSRDEMRNSPVAAGALNGTVTGVVGTGLSAMPSVDHEALGITEDAAAAWNDDTRRRFEVWAGSENSDAARVNDFYSNTGLAKRTWLESGDCFVITPRISRAGRAPQLAIQIIEGDRVCNPGKAANTATLIEGIELNPDTSEPIAVHIARFHPGDIATGGQSWTRVPIRGDLDRRNVLHLFDVLRPGQVRGIPWIAPILEPLKQLGRWTENELNAAVTSSIFSVFAKMDAQAFQDIFDGDGESDQLIKDRSQWSGKLESGKVINLLPGEELGSVSSTRPNPEFDPFWMAIMRQIGMVLEIPVEVLTMHFQSSYSAARGALLLVWRMYKTRRDKLAKKFCQPLYELWLADEVADGRIAAPGFFADALVRAAWSRCLWMGDGPGSIDPQKEAAGAKARVDMETSTLDAESILHDGIPWKVKHRQRTREIAAQKADGTYMPPAGVVAAAPAAPQDDEPVPGNLPK